MSFIPKSCLNKEENVSPMVVECSECERLCLLIAGHSCATCGPMMTRQQQCSGGCRDQGRGQALTSPLPPSTQLDLPHRAVVSSVSVIPLLL